MFKQVKLPHFEVATGSSNAGGFGLDEYTTVNRTTA
jgi:hypothetical protein